MSDDLVKRLRTEPNWMREDYPQSEAADRIEAQAARIAKLEAALLSAKQHFVADEPLKAFVEICFALRGKDE